MIRLQQGTRETQAGLSGRTRARQVQSLLRVRCYCQHSGLMLPSTASTVVICVSTVWHACVNVLQPSIYFPSDRRQLTDHGLPLQDLAGSKVNYGEAFHASKVAGRSHETDMWHSCCHCEPPFVRQQWYLPALYPCRFLAPNYICLWLLIINS